MILTNTIVLETNSLSDFGWSALRRFHNIPYVEDLIMQRRNLPKSHRANARKQASQIRDCLMQAEEYFIAGSTVSSATRPVLYYYSIMSLALAEILMKQDGLSSLDKAREQHRHHGLLFSFGNAPNDSDLRAKAQRLVAKPMRRPNGEPFGTFALWHRSCREMPAVGKITTDVEGGQTITHGIVLGATDNQFSQIPLAGLNLFDCLSALPPLRGTTQLYGLKQNFVRAKAERHIFRNGSDTLAITIQPSPPEVVTSFFENCLFDANSQNRINFQKFPISGIITLTNNTIDGGVGARIPHGMNLTQDEICFWPRAQPLNEFGYFYVALFIAGNYARYYPDHWLRNVDTRADLSLAIDDLLTAAKRRMALLTLSELSGTYFVPEE